MPIIRKLGAAWADDADPNAAEPFCGIRLAEDPRQQGRRHGPRLVQMVGGEDRPVHDPVEPAADLLHSG